MVAKSTNESRVHYSTKPTRGLSSIGGKGTIPFILALDTTSS